MKKTVATLIGLLLLAGVHIVAAQTGRVVIEEEGQSSGDVGVQGRVGDDGFDVRFNVQPETSYQRKTTITTYGQPGTEIRVYTEYPGCPPPCNHEYCYPASHECRDCNRYHPSPCPPY